MRLFWFRVAAGVSALCFVGVACSAGDRGPAIEVDDPDALVDEPVHIRITGLRPGAVVTLRSQATDYLERSWGARAVFAADGNGVVDLRRAKPRSGSYTDADGMGLFWSMALARGDPEDANFVTYFPWVESSFRIRITATLDGKNVAQASLTRRWLATGVTRRTLDLETDNVVGELYLPPKDTSPRTAVLMFGGSGGGFGRTVFEAPLLASRGHPTLALAYFNSPGLPKTLHEIPLEYFATAARLLGKQPGVDRRRVYAMGYSRGSEPALLLGVHYPNLVRGAVVYAPSSQVNPGFPGGGTAWTHNGRPIPQSEIPVERLTGRVLAVAGTNDRLWPSEAFARAIEERLCAHRFAYEHQVQLYVGSGHNVGVIPHIPMGTSVLHPISRTVIDLGGTRAADAFARADAWPKLLSFLARSGRPPECGVQTERE